MNKPSPDWLQACLRLADDIDELTKYDQVDAHRIDELIEKSRLAANGLRRLVAAQSSETT